MLTGEFPPRRGGVGDYTERLTGALRDLGHEVTVLTAAAPVTGEPPPAWRRVRDWGTGCWRVVEVALKRSRAELLHVQYQAGAYQLKGAVNLLPYWLRAHRPEIRIVTTFHDLLVPYLFPKAGPLRRRAVEALLHGSHGAIFVDAADLARAGSGPNRRWVPIGSNIPCAPAPDFDCTATRLGLGAKDDVLLIGYFGFLSASKGADTLLRALRLLLDDGRAACLALIGAGAGSSNPSDYDDQHSVLRLAGGLGLEGYIQTTGYLAPPEVSACLLACDVMALPYEDGASFRRGSLLAALEHGCPIVTTMPAPEARGVGERALEPGRQVLAVPAGDPAGLAEAIGRLADDAPLRARLSAEARVLAARFDWRAIADETAALYAACLA